MRMVTGMTKNIMARKKIRTITVYRLFLSKWHILTCTTSCNDLDGGTNIFQLFSLLYTSERTSIRGGLLAEFEYFLIGNPLEPSDGEVVQEYFNIMSSKGSAVWGGWPGGVNRLINIGWLDGWAGPVDSTSTTPLPPLVPGEPHLLELLPAAVIFHPNIFTLDWNNITSATLDPWIKDRLQPRMW